MTSADAFNYLIQGKLAEAEELYRKITSDTPDDLSAIYELGLTCLLQHKYEDAQDIWFKLLGKWPNNVFLQYELARAAMLAHNYQDAQDRYEEIIALMPDDVVCLNQLARLYNLQGKDKDAQGILQNVAFVQSSHQHEESREMTMVDPQVAGLAAEPDGTMMDPVSAAIARESGVSSHLKSKGPSTAAFLQDAAAQGQEETSHLARMVFDDFLAKERLLGQGGMGEVFLVRHLEWDKRLAVKRCLRTDNQILMEKFRQECLTWLSLEKHHNVVSAVHFTTWESKPSLLIEYIEGTTLKEVIRSLRIHAMVEQILDKLGNRPSLNKTMAMMTFFGGPEERRDIGEAWMTIMKHNSLNVEEVKTMLRGVFQDHEIEALHSRWSHLASLSEPSKYKFQDVLDYAIQICWGMAHAHRHKMLHRDLKPANILIEEELNGPGIAKVTDFGLAKMNDKTATQAPVQFAESTSEEEASSGVVGTPRYMAPEQWSSISTERSDIYAFGMMIYELFTAGHSPFTSHIDEKSKTGSWWLTIPQQNEFYYWSVRHSSDTPIAPKSYAAEIPQPLEDLILKCLAKEAEQRPASFDEVADALLKIFVEMANAKYPREQSVAPDLIAMELNNRAISMLEMKFAKDGQQQLEKALKISPNLLEVQVNSSLFELQQGNLSLPEFTSKSQNWFNGTDKDVMVLTVLAGIYFEYGCFYQMVHQKLRELTQKFPKDLKLKRLSGKMSYLTGNFILAEKTFKEFCSLESARLEDWYHFVAALYYQGKQQQIQQWMDQAPPHFKFHPCFKEIKRILREPPLATAAEAEERQWYEIAVLPTADPEAEILFLKHLPQEKYVAVYRNHDEQTLCDYYHLPDLAYKTCMIPIASPIQAKQAALLPGGILATLSLQGEVYLVDLKTEENRTLTGNIAQEAQDGLLLSATIYLVAIYHLTDAQGEPLSHVVLWRQDTFESVAALDIAGQILYAGLHEKEGICWLADRNALYRWEFLTPTPPSSQIYGYYEEATEGQGYVKVEIIGVYTLAGPRLFVLQQTEDVKDHQTVSSLQLYLWDLETGRNHHNANFDRFTGVLHAMTPDSQQLYLLGSCDDANSHFVRWDIESWEAKQQNDLEGNYQGMELAPDGTFILMKQRSLLDLAVNFLATESEQNLIYTINPWQKAKKFQSLANCMHLTGTLPSQLLFVSAPNQQVHVWKLVAQEAFPLVHKLSYLYLKPTSTLQDIGVQKRINLLLEESTRALKEGDMQRSLDYLRGIQNFKGYDWSMVMDRVHRIALVRNWQKIGMRESLKTKKLAWPEQNFIVSPDGRYLIPAGAVTNALPQLWDIANWQEKHLGQIIASLEDGQGAWFPSADGRFFLHHHNKQLNIYDLQNQNRLSSLPIPIKFQEAVSNRNASVILFKEEGMGRLFLLDLVQRKLISNISQTKYHTLQDCCVMAGDGQKILLGNEIEGGFRWELIQKEVDTWKTKFYELPFNENQIMQGKTEADATELTVLSNRSYVIFRGTNYDLTRDIYFRHMEAFELKHELFFSLKDQKFCEAWLKAKAIATTPEGNFTFLGIGTRIEIWHTAGHIKNWNHLLTIEPHTQPIGVIAVTGDGKFLMSGDISGEIKIVRIGILREDLKWAHGEWEVIENLKADDAIAKLYISPNDRYLFAGCPGAIHVWEFDWIWEVERYTE